MFQKFVEVEENRVKVTLGNMSIKLAVINDHS